MPKKPQNKKKTSLLQKKIKKVKTGITDFITSKNLQASKNIKKLVGVVLSVAIIVVIIVLMQVEKKTEYATTIVKKGTLTQTVNETGVIQSSGRIDLNFLNTGRIDQILVKVGDEVKKNQILAQLDYSNLLIRQKEAQANLTAQKAILDKLLQGATKEEIAVSESSLNQAKASYNATKLELTEVEKTNQENIRQAKANLENLAQKDQDDITAHEQAVHVAQVNLVSTRDSYKKTVNDYKASAITAIKNDLTIINTALDNVNTILTNDTIKDTFSAKDTSYLNNARENYELALTSKLEANGTLGLIHDQSDYEVINNALMQTSQAINDTFKALKNTYSALENTVISLYFTQIQLDSFKAITSAQLTLVSASKAEIQSITQGLETANLNYINQVELADQNLAQAQASLNDAFLTAQNNFNTVKLASQKQTTLVKAKLNNAKEALNVADARLKQVKAPARALDIALQKTQITQAEAMLESILNSINDSIIKAPEDGTIIKVNYKVGEQNLAQPVVSMLFDDNLEIEVDISETDIIKVEKGDKVEVTLDAFGENVKFNGKVSFIEPAETLIQDVVYYKVAISLDLNLPLAKKIKPGMSANVTIVTDKKENVLIVPYRALVSRNGSGELVRILINDIMSEMPIKTGMRGDGGNIEVLEGVKKGDIVVTYVKQ